MAAPIDKLIAAKWLKGKADSLYKEAESEASAQLSELNESVGAMEIASKVFDGASFKYSKTRAKAITEYNMADRLAFADWLLDNEEACKAYVQNNAEQFGRWWFEATGEVPDGISPVEYTQEARISAPKLYGYDGENVEQTIMDNHLLAGFGGLLTGGVE